MAKRITIRAVKIGIELGNAAFDGDCSGHEVARILRLLADSYEETGLGISQTLRDINGNTVGKAVVARVPAQH